jgi:hypothetical protein
MRSFIQQMLAASGRTKGLATRTLTKVLVDAATPEDAKRQAKVWAKNRGYTVHKITRIRPVDWMMWAWDVELLVDGAGE